MKPGGLTQSFACIAVLALGGVYAAPLGSAVVTTELPSGWTMTDEGPLGPADRDLLSGVRLATVWEREAALLTQKRANIAKVIEAGEKIVNEHIELDELVRALAARLDIILPDQPNHDQRGWLAEIPAARGEEFDRVFVDRLRTENGRLFAVIAGVRAGTRNDLVRSFASTANDAVLRHMTYLERTGLVNYATLPLPPKPAVGDPADRLTATNTGSLGPAVTYSSALGSRDCGCDRQDWMRRNAR